MQQKSTTGLSLDFSRKNDEIEAYNNANTELKNQISNLKKSIADLRVETEELRTNLENAVNAYDKALQEVLIPMLLMMQYLAIRTALGSAIMFPLHSLKIHSGIKKATVARLKKSVWRIMQPACLAE